MRHLVGKPGLGQGRGVGLEMAKTPPGEDPADGKDLTGQVDGRGL